MDPAHEDERSAIEALALRLRRAIEAVPPGSRPLALTEFPRGACGDASLLLGAWLADNGFSKFVYVCGERGSHKDGSWRSHAWLEDGDLVVDITADQFRDGPGRVVVASPSAWHQGWEQVAANESDLRKYAGPGIPALKAFFERLRLELMR